MKTLTKPSLLLFALVLTIYVMRQNQISSTGVVKTAFRILTITTNSSVSICNGIDISNSFSAAETTRAAQFQQGLQKSRGGNPLLTVITGGFDDSSNLITYAKGLIPFAAPWAALFIVSLLLCIGLLCNWCCMYGCCKNCGCCNCCKLPKNTRRKKFYVAMSALFLLGTFSAGIAGIILAAGVPKGMKYSFCSGVALVDHVISGKPEDSWMGIKNAVVSINNVLSLFNSTVNSMTAITGPFAAMGNDYTATLNALNTMYTNNANKTATRTDPSVTGSYQISYTWALGPSSDSSSATGIMLSELTLKNSTITAAAAPINSAISNLKSSQTSIFSAIKSGADTAKQISDSASNLLSSINDTGTTINNIIGIVGSVLTGIFIANTTLGIFGIVCIVMVGLLKINFFNKLLHLDWCLIGLLTILGFILSTVFLPVSIVLMEACDVLQTSLSTSSAFAQNLGNSTQAAKLINTCLFGTNGNALDNLGVTAQLDFFNTIYAQLSAVDNVTNITSGASTAPPAYTILAQQDLINAYLAGTVPDATEVATDLGTLNGIVTNSCTNLVKDTWVLNSGNCTTAMGSKFVASSGDTFDLPNPTCVGYDIWKVSPQTNNVNSRYTASNIPTGTCSKDYTVARSFVTNFVNNRVAVKNVFTNINTDLTNVKNKQANFASDIQSILNTFKNLQSSVKSIQDALTGSANGLIPNMNCKFIGNDLRVLTNNMCVGFISSVYQSTVVIIIVSFMTLFSFIGVSCLAKRFLVQASGKATSPISYK